MTLSAQTNTRRRLALLFSVPLAFSLVFFFVNLAAERTDIHLLKVQNLSSSIIQLRSLAKDAESGERGFLLTGDDRYLMPLEQANESLPSQISACLDYARDWPELRGQVVKLTQLVKTRFDEVNEVLRIQRAKGFAAALDYTRSGASEQTMNEVRRTADDLQSKLNSEERGYLDSEAALNKRGFIFFILSTLVMIVVLAWLYHVLLSHLYERDEAQRQLQILNSELEARIDERTHDLKEANEELGQFAYVASHDLQEPLRTITSFTQLLESRYKGRLDEDADEFIGYIVASSRRMTDLINGLLALVRLRKSGQQTAPVSFEKLLEEAEISLQAAIRDNRAQIEHGPLPSLVVDRVQFSQVLQNLISNGIKYRKEEPPHIRVEANRDSSNWIFSVADNGRGFNQQYAERIFGLFQRLHGRDVEGTGMGLSIARKIVERHGGRIWAESVEGQGSTFYFSLPVSLELSRLAGADQTSPVVAQVSN
ncbi:MAG: CHASE3 domain-containing protein [Acidobacteriaceae bacterium]|nr:CHASE3 domain-containing protein [Acidobacteriaceae bacterium]MBV9765236.1 CHASE3 domain-containing protein [Acidobacteriaceae bacterium]